MKNFQPFKIYQGRSVCDYDCKINVHVLSRTAKTIKALVDGEHKTLRVTVGYEGFEFVKPWGSYSMAPIVTAEKLIG